MAADRILKRAAARTVIREEKDGSDRAVVVKRFHHPHPLRALRDRRRARNELELLGHLADAGVAVPRPLGLTPRGGHWEVRMEWIPGAVSLDTWLEHPDGDARGSSRDSARSVAERLARTLSGLHRAGVEHPDLHPGNFLVDPADAVWLVDLHQARRRRRPIARARREDDLVTLAAGLRERSPELLRARFLRAYCAELPATERLSGSERAALGARVEALGRRRRRAAVARSGGGRWLRESSVCEVAEGPEGRILRRRGTRMEDAGLVLEGPSRSALLVRWRNSARLLEHRVPCATPLQLRTGGREEAARASFELELGASAEAPVWPADPVPPGTLARELGRLLGLLHERGLDLPSLGQGDVGLRGDGSLFLLPPASLVELEPLDPGLTPARRLRAVGGEPPSARGREALLQGYLSAFSPRERRRLASRCALPGAAGAAYSTSPASRA